MAKDERWRNALIWAAASFMIVGVIMLSAISLLSDGGLEAVLESDTRIAVVSLTLIFSTVLVGISQRNLPFNRRNLRNLLIWIALGVVISLLIKRGSAAFAGDLLWDAMGVSAKIALVLGLVLLALAIQLFLMIAAAHMSDRLLSEAQSEAIRDLGRASIYSALKITALGLMLILLSLAGSSGVLPPMVALMGVAALLCLRIALSFAQWPLLDELSQTIARETRHAAFYFVIYIGGSWAILAHLGFVPAPAPLDWLILFTLITYTASFIAAAKRGLLASL